MDCMEFKNIVVDLFDRETDPQVKAECERHMAECDECKRYYDEMAHVTALLRPHHSPATSTSRRSRRWLQTAAIFIGVLMLSGIAFAAVQLVKATSQAKQSQSETVQPIVSNTQLSENDSTMMKPVVFENAELKVILGEIATYYNYKVIYKGEEAQHTRLYFTWDKQMPIEEIIETFNQFNRIHITVKDCQLLVE